MWGVFSHLNDIVLFLVIFPGISLHFKVQFQSNTEDTNMAMQGRI